MTAVGALLSPSSGSAVAAAAQWLEDVFLGNAASALAVIAVAWVGILLLQGRLPVSRTLRVILGCFIIFGSATIAAGLIGLAQATRQPVEVIALPPPQPALAPPHRPATNPDPYAGASVPM